MASVWTVRGQRFVSVLSFIRGQIRAGNEGAAALGGPSVLACEEIRRIWHAGFVQHAERGRAGSTESRYSGRNRSWNSFLPAQPHGSFIYRPWSQAALGCLETEVAGRMFFSAAPIKPFLPRSSGTRPGQRCAHTLRLKV